MVLDTSALLAILQDEPERRSFSRAIESTQVRLVSAATLLETSIVIEVRYGLSGLHHLDLLLAKAAIDTVPFDREQVELAREAFHRFGKGRHPAALNFGDCCSYALAKARGEPLLYKGEDFARTDIGRFAVEP